MTVDALRNSVPPYDFKHWIRPIECAQIDDLRREIVLRTPDASHSRWIEENFVAEIQRVLSSLTDGKYAIHFTTSVTGGMVPDALAETASNLAPNLAFLRPVRTRPAGLIDRYRFDTFVDGPTNVFAFTAAKAVAEHPGRRYNPLFLYGGVGLGKTHLLHAIGHAVHDRDPSARILYVSSEAYMNDLITAIRTDGMPAFRRRYRDECDVLLIDDVQFLAGKDRTQEEFFHMFNTLHSSHKQIVLTCDQLPRSIPDVEDRLKSRLEWGLISDIKPPCFETRVAILKRKAEADEIALPDDVAMLLARHIIRNVRELEGALMRLEANARIFGSSISLAMAREVLGDLVREDARKVTLEGILKVVAHEFKASIVEIKGPRRHRTIIVPRQVAMYLARDLTDASLPQLGSAFGGRDHTTVLNALKRVRQMRDADPQFRERVDRLRRELASS
jgi:chromosomal replication initiator protein